ncbi:MAG TPA: hypothetical protein VES42_18015, partial [Pilimelia sp.]|nr:hypothetical protein [Pilimelia sp.]
MTAAGPLGLSGGHVGDRAAEEWLDDLLGRLGIPAADVFACTHHVRSPYPHVALSLVLPAGAAVGPADLPPVPA